MSTKLYTAQRDLSSLGPEYVVYNWIVHIFELAIKHI